MRTSRRINLIKTQVVSKEQRVVQNKGRSTSKRKSQPRRKLVTKTNSCSKKPMDSKPKSKSTKVIETVHYINMFPQNICTCHEVVYEDKTRNELEVAECLPSL